MIFNPEVKEKAVLRSKIIKEIRDFFWKEGFLEVETPILQPIYGGTEAKPFKTHLNALDMDLYLRIAPELYLKRLIVGGFEKVFEIGKCFRNEGVDKSHNPDFSEAEFYWAYADYKDVMQLTEKLFATILKNVFGGLKMKYDGKEINFKAPWKRIENQTLWQPPFVIHHPANSLPLAKQLDSDPSKLGSVQLVAGGWELVKAYSELN